MKFTLILAAFVASAMAGAIPRQVSGKAPGTQFITGPCGSDADCASGCCNAKTALCAARAVAEENNGPGCGFGGAAAAPAAAPAAAAPAAAAGGSGKAPGTQFITGPCGSDADCASGCCNAKTALCAARAVAEENNGPGCGFGGASLAGAAPAAAATSPAAAAPAAAAPAAAPAAAAAGSGKPPGTQFITGPCANDAECNSGCCNAKTALCAARLVAEEGAGCGFGGSNAGADAKTANRRRRSVSTLF